MGDATENESTDAARKISALPSNERQFIGPGDLLYLIYRARADQRYLEDERASERREAERRAIPLTGDAKKMDDAMKANPIQRDKEGTLEWLIRVSKIAGLPERFEALEKLKG